MIFPGWNCTKDEINIETGQGRHSRYVAFVRVSQETYDTALSQARTGTVDDTSVKAWHSVNTFAPPSRHYCPHYRFHGALHQAAEVELLFKVLKAASERKAEIAQQILKAWQMTGSDDGAKDILTKLWKEAEVSNQASETIGLPQPQR